MFPNQILLHVNKRLKNPEDREKLKLIKEDIFNLNMNVIDIFKKYGFNIIDNMAQLETCRIFAQELIK